MEKLSVRSNGETTGWETFSNSCRRIRLPKFTENRFDGVGGFSRIALGGNCCVDGKFMAPTGSSLGIIGSGWLAVGLLTNWMSKVFFDDGIWEFHVLENICVYNYESNTLVVFWNGLSSGKLRCRIAYLANLRKSLSLSSIKSGNSSKSESSSSTSAMCFLKTMYVYNLCIYFLN